MTNLPYQTDDVKLKEHLEKLLVEQGRYFEAKFTAIDEATRTAHVSMNARLNGMNEFRDALKDQASQMITRNEFNLALGQIRLDLVELQKYRNVADGKASQTSVLLFGFLSVAAFFISLLKLF